MSLQLGTPDRGTEHKHRSLPPSDLRQSGNLRHTCLLCAGLHTLEALIRDASGDGGRLYGTVEDVGGGRRDSARRDC